MWKSISVLFTGGLDDWQNPGKVFSERGQDQHLLIVVNKQIPIKLYMTLHKKNSLKKLYTKCLFMLRSKVKFYLEINKWRIPTLLPFAGTWCWRNETFCAKLM